MTEFVNENPHYLDPENALAFLSDDEGGSYNMCHCTCCAICSRPFKPAKWSRIVWSNFEIANLDFWRGEAYSKFFEHLESKGGFYYEVRRSISPIAPSAPAHYLLSIIPLFVTHVVNLHAASTPRF